MELALKHIAPYLPYGLKMIYTHTNKIGLINNLYQISENNHDDIKLSIEFYSDEHIWMFKPILRPLSDLTKEIEVNGKKFVPINYLENTFCGFYFAFGNNKGLLIKRKNTNMYHDIMHSNEIIEKLLEWHFDIFGLIEKGLAIKK